MTTLVMSKNGTVHIQASTYTNQSGGQNIVGACNKVVFGPKPTGSSLVTCKLCARKQ